MFYLILSFRGSTRLGPSVARQIRMVCEGLGGLWVPFARLVARQGARFSRAFCDELATAQYAEPTLNFAEAKNVIESELGAPVEELFLDFDPVPLASRPFAQLFRATIRTRGKPREVVVQVLQPGAREQLERDLAAIQRSVWVLRAADAMPASSIEEMLGELDAERRELSDYRYELAEHRRLRRSLKGDRQISLHRAFPKWSGASVQTREFVPAVSLRKFLRVRDENPRLAAAWCDDNNINPVKVGRRLFALYLRQVCENGEFDRSMDLRSVVLLRKNRIKLVGMRSLRTLQQSYITLYEMFLRSICEGRFEKAADCVLLLCESLPPTDLAAVKSSLVRELRSFAARTSLRPGTREEKSIFHLQDRLFRILDRSGIRAAWQLHDLHLGWANLEQTLAALCPEDDTVARLRSYFEQAARRAEKQQRQVSAKEAMGKVLGSVSEFATLQSIELRKQARVFQSAVGKGALFGAAIVRLVRWFTLGGVGIGAAYLAFNAWPNLAESISGRVIMSNRLESFLALPKERVILALSALVVIAWILGRLVGKLLETEPVELRRS